MEATAALSAGRAWPFDQACGVGPLTGAHTRAGAWPPGLAPWAAVAGRQGSKKEQKTAADSCRSFFNFTNP